MCLNMAQIMAVVEFFKRYAAQESAKGIKNLVDKIEYFNEEEQILTEQPFIPDPNEPQLESDTVVKYYLLMRPPLLKEIKLTKPN